MIGSSIMVAAIFVSLAYYFADFGGNFFTLPGSFIAEVLSAFYWMAFTSGDDFRGLPQGTEVVVNLVIYSFPACVVLWIIRSGFEGEGRSATK